MKKRIIAGLVLLVLAIGICLYPLVSNFLSEKYMSIAEARHNKEIAMLDDRELQLMRQLAEQYNATLVPGASGELRFTQAALQQASENYEALLNIRGDGIMGYVSVPKIDVELPIFHGTGEESLNRGAGHLLGSSLPVGGASSHSVITAHSGLAGQRMFSDLSELEAGDVFYLHVLGERMAYMVREINTVLPEDTSKLSIQPGQDMCTLVTCTPYGINTHRLMVHSLRIAEEDAEAIIETKMQSEAETFSTWENEYLKGLGVGMLVLFAAGVLYELKRIWPGKRGRRESR